MDTFPEARPETQLEVDRCRLATAGVATPGFGFNHLGIFFFFLVKCITQHLFINFPHMDYAS